MTDTTRDVRDRLGEALRSRGAWRGIPWHRLDDQTRKHWRREADNILTLVASCGLKIVPDDGETK